MTAHGRPRQRWHIRTDGIRTTVHLDEVAIDNVSAVDFEHRGPMELAELRITVRPRDVVLDVDEVAGPFGEPVVRVAQADIDAAACTFCGHDKAQHGGMYGCLVEVDRELCTCSRFQGRQS